MTSAEATRPTLPNIALNALYVACLLWLTEHRNAVADVTYTPRQRILPHHFSSQFINALYCNLILRRPMHRESKNGDTLITLEHKYFSCH